MSGRDACREEVKSLGKKQFGPRETSVRERCTIARIHFCGSHLISKAYIWFSILWLRYFMRFRHRLRKLGRLRLALEMCECNKNSDSDLRTKLCIIGKYADIIMDNGYLRAEPKEKFARGIGRPWCFRCDIASSPARVCARIWSARPAHMGKLWFSTEPTKTNGASQKNGSWLSEIFCGTWLPFYRNSVISLL